MATRRIDVSVWEELSRWLDTPGRSVRRMVRLNGHWLVELEGEEVYSSNTQQSLKGAVRNALMVAYMLEGK